MGMIGFYPLVSLLAFVGLAIASQSMAFVMIGFFTMPAIAIFALVVAMEARRKKIPFFVWLNVGTLILTLGLIAYALSNRP